MHHQFHSCLFTHLVVAFKNWHGETRRFVDSSSGDIAFIMSWLSCGHCGAVVVIPIDLRRTPNGWRRWAGLGWAGLGSSVGPLQLSHVCRVGRRVGQWQHINNSTHSPPSLSPTHPGMVWSSIQRNIVVMHVFCISVVISIGVIGDCVGDLNPIPFPCPCLAPK